MVINPLVNTVPPNQAPPAGGQTGGDAFAAILSTTPALPPQLAVASTAPLPLHAELPLQAQPVGVAAPVPGPEELAATTATPVAGIPPQELSGSPASPIKPVVLLEEYAVSAGVATPASAAIHRSPDGAPAGAELSLAEAPKGLEATDPMTLPELTPSEMKEQPPAPAPVFPAFAVAQPIPGKQAQIDVRPAEPKASNVSSPADLPDEGELRVEERVDHTFANPLESVLSAIADPEPATSSVAAPGVDPTPVRTGEKAQQLAGGGTEIATARQVASAADRIMAAVKPIRPQDSAPLAPASEHAPVADGTHERVAALPFQTTMQPAQAASIQPSATAQPQVERPVPFRPDRIGERMGVEVARAIKDGKEELVVRLDPAELGRINIRMRFDEGGALRAVVAAESTIVAEAIRRDAVELTRALTDAGVRADTQSFRFDRGSGGEAGAGGQWQQQRGQSHGRSFSGSDERAPAEDQRPRRLSASGRIDLIA